MPDIYSKQKRSAVMAAVRSKGNKTTEQVLVALFRRSGVKGWRRHVQMKGHPDFTFRRERLVVFVGGCFWHGCPKHSSVPLNNRDFWLKKLNGNADRDRRVTKGLEAGGWRVIRIWEHDLRQPARSLARVRAALLKATAAFSASSRRASNPSPS